jgi:diacylglycerol kinase family enzyme
MRYFLVLNPGSRGGKSKSRFQHIFEQFHQRNLDYDYGMTAGLDDAYALSRNANAAGYGAIVAVGGDGTINKVLNGFYDETGRRISTAAMGVLYTGTSPDFCKSYGIPFDLDAGLETLFDNHALKIMIGKITLSKFFLPEYADRQVSEEPYFVTRYFNCCVNIGIGATLARFANSGIRKRIGDFGGTLVSLLRSLRSYVPSTFHIIQDGMAFEVQRMFNLSVGKTYYIASGIKVKSELGEMDHRFYCLTIRDLKLLDLIPCLNMLYSGKRIHNNRFTRLEYCTSIQILGNAESAEVEFDGDPQGFLPCSIEMAKDPLDLIVREK